jgi:uncharacterized protein YdeI (YjbR/CyaY-like superfamily)
VEITETCYAATRQEWRSWLEEHHTDRAAIWLIGYRKEAGKPFVAYEDAVKEALCFGWIDSIRKGLGDQRWAQRYTPRREGSPISQTNQERLARLLDSGRVIPSVASSLGDLRPQDYAIPNDILRALRAAPGAWDHWQSFSSAYRRIRSAYVDGSRGRPDVFAKRLAHLVRKTAEGKQFGYGIQEFY